MIRIWLALQMAVRELARNLTRTALTSLGILIGVGAVIAMVGLGTGATRSIEDDLASMGNNLIMAQPGVDDGPRGFVGARPFRQADADAIARQVRHVAAVAPAVFERCLVGVPCFRCHLACPAGIAQVQEPPRCFRILFQYSLPILNWLYVRPSCLALLHSRDRF